MIDKPGKQGGDHRDSGDHNASGGSSDGQLSLVESDHIEKKTQTAGEDKPGKVLFPGDRHLCADRNDQQTAGSYQITQESQGKRGKVLQGQACQNKSQ